MKELGVDEDGIPLVWIERYKNDSMLFQKEVGSAFWTELKRDFGWRHRYSKIAGTDLPAELHVPPQFADMVTKSHKWFPSFDGRYYWGSREELLQWIGKKLGVSVDTGSRADEQFIRLTNKYSGSSSSGSSSSEPGI